MDIILQYSNSNSNNKTSLTYSDNSSNKKQKINTTNDIIIAEYDNLINRYIQTNIYFQSSDITFDTIKHYLKNVICNIYNQLILLEKNSIVLFDPPYWNSEGLQIYGVDILNEKKFYKIFTAQILTNANLKKYFDMIILVVMQILFLQKHITDFNKLIVLSFMCVISWRNNIFDYIVTAYFPNLNIGYANLIIYDITKKTYWKVYNDTNTYNSYFDGLVINPYLNDNGNNKN
jgi:hypothetical protein